MFRVEVDKLPQLSMCYYAPQKSTLPLTPPELIQSREHLVVIIFELGNILDGYLEKTGTPLTVSVT